MSLNLPTSEELVIEDAELRSILAKIAKRSAGGRAVSGRYNKHDTARLRFIRSIALPGIRFGQLVPDDDMRMLRLGPMNVLHGVDLASMDEWAQRHGRDPRSKKKDGWLDETEQATLFRWLSCNEKHLVVSNSARRGAPRAFQLDFGAYEGHRLEQLVQHSIQSGGRTHLLPVAKRTASTPRPGAYVLWLASGAFDWSFPRHLHLYLMLKSMEANGAYVWPDAALAGAVAIKVSETAEQEYESHVAVTLAPLAGERNPYGGGGSRGASGGAAAQPTTEAADDGDEGADADPGWSPMDDIDRVENALPNAQNEYFQSILDEVAGGSRPLFGNWQRMDTYPADPTCGSCDDADGFALMPIDWWSPPTFWASKGVTAPCIVGGWAHSHAVSLGEWRQRRAKGLFSDRGLAGQRTECSLCKQQHAHLKQHLAALKTQDPRSAMITTLEEQIKATPYRASTLHPKFNQLLFERFNWLAVKMPAVVTHRTAISTEVLELIVRGARTAQSAHDLEAMLREFRAIRNAKLRLTFYGMQRLSARLAASRGKPAAPVEHFDVGISSISDNYIADALLAFVASHEKYILQWHEQHVQADYVQADHHGKRFSRMSVDGDKLLNWRCAD